MRGSVCNRRRGSKGGWRRREWKGRHVTQGDLLVNRDGVHVARKGPKSRTSRSQSVRSSAEVP